MGLGLTALVAVGSDRELKGAVIEALLIGLGAGIATFAATLVYETLFAGGDEALDRPTAAGMTAGTFLVTVIQMIYASLQKGKLVWPGVADVVGWGITALGFFIAWQAPPLVANPLLVAAVGAAMAGLGLGIAVFFHSPLDIPPIGYIDEGMDAAFFGFSLASVAAEAAA